MIPYCVICADIFDENNSICAATCGHVYHSTCLSSWIRKSNTCPQCRLRITAENIKTLYLDFTSSVSNSSDLEKEVLKLKAQLSAKKNELESVKKEKDRAVRYARFAEQRGEDLQQENYKMQSDISELHIQIKKYSLSDSERESKHKKLEDMYAALENDLKVQLSSKNLQLESARKDKEDAVKFARAAKKRAEESRNNLIDENATLKQENERFAAKVKFYEDALTTSPKENKPTLSSSYHTQKKTSLNSPVSNKPSSSTNKNLYEDSEISISPLKNIQITSNYDDGIELISNPSEMLLTEQKERSILIRYHGATTSSLNRAKTVIKRKPWT